MPEKLLATRPAKDSDFQYVWDVYREAVKAHIGPKLKGGWVDSVEVEKFRKTWKAGDSHIVLMDSIPIGWSGVVASEKEVRIEHLYIEPQHRGKGYGTRLVSEMTKRWTNEGKAVYAPVLREKRLVTAISRLGFSAQGGADDHPLVQTLVYDKNT